MQTATDIEIEKELVADQLSFPTSICFDDKGTPYVATSGLPWDGATKGGEIVKIGKDRKVQLIAGGFGYPVNGLCFHQGNFIVSDGSFPGKIYRLSLDGTRDVILDNLPGLGNYHTNMVAIGPDGKIYFSQGALTNTGVIGMDAYELGWLGRLPHNCDVPGYDIVLNGSTFETVNPLEDDKDTAKTSAFSPFNSTVEDGKKIKGQTPCTAAIMRCGQDGKDLELVAWGMRNGYGMHFMKDGRLIVTDQGSDDRGSRPVGHVPDCLYEVKEGAWYGWPDFIAGIPITDERFTPQRGPKPDFVLKHHKDLPTAEVPLLEFPVNAAAVKLDQLPDGRLVVALFGDEKPMTAPPGKKAGRNISWIDPRDWSLHHFPNLGFERPIDVKYNKYDERLYVLDFGYFEMTKTGVDATSKTGKLWALDPGHLFNNE